MRVSELQVPHASQIVRLFNRDLPADQWRRELLENARLAGATEVNFGPWIDPETGRALMRVLDNGCGMNPRALEERIRKLAVPTTHETFGIGGRIATAAVSPEGVAWASKEEGAPAAMVVMREVRGDYGLVQFPQDDGRFAHAVEPDAGMLPPSYSHGTAVVLYGVEWSQRKAYGLALSLAQRYWSFAETMVSVHGWDSPEKGWKKRVPAYGELVDRFTEASGRVNLADGSVVRWYRLRDHAKGKRHSLLSGCLTVQHGVELLDRADRARFAQFVLSRKAQARIVLVIEPAASLEIEMNAQRSRLGRPGGKALPWNAWARSWTERMPDEVRELLPAAAALDLETLAAAFGPDWRNRIRKTVRPVTGRGQERGEATVEVPATSLEREELEPGDEAEKPDESPEEEPAASYTREPRRKAVRVAADGRTRSRRAQRHDIPKVVALDGDEWTYDGFDFAYEEVSNELRYLKSGEAITRQTAYWVERRPDLPSNDVVTTVQSAYAVEMVGKILHVLDTFVGRPEWTEPLDILLSPRTLTVASLGFLAVDAMIEQGLSRAGLSPQELLPPVLIP
jgi:hypothetical protein